MPKISIIVPIWNVEKYLPKCLDSLINQTLKDIEIICINDGSPDNCLNILKEYKAKDDRIVIIDQINQGVSVARNKGLEIAKGEYIGFVDPDDWVDLDFYEVLYNKAIETDADIIKGNLIYHIGTTNYIDDQLNEFIKSNKFEFDYQFVAAIYKTKFIADNNISFKKEFIIGEDFLFLLEALYYTNNIIIFTRSNSYYHYDRNIPNSADSKKLNQTKITNLINANNQRLKFINSNQIDEESYLIVFNHIMMNLIEHSFNKCYKEDSALEILKKSVYFLKECKYRESFLKQYKKNYHKYLINNDIEGLYRYLKSSSEYQTKYNLKLFNLISLFKIKVDSNGSNSIKNKLYILHILILKTVRKNNKIYVKLFGFIPLLKIKKV